MFIFFNLIGLGFAILALAIGYGLMGLFPSLDGPKFWIVTLGVLLGLDLAYRYFSVRSKLEQVGDGLKTDLGSHWLTTGQGGSLMFLPAWLIAILLGVLGAVIV